MLRKKMNDKKCINCILISLETSIPIACCTSKSYRSDKRLCLPFDVTYNWIPSNVKKSLESIHYNLVRKIRQHIGGQFLHQTNLRKSVGHAQQGSSLTLHKSLVVRDPLWGFSQICLIQKLATNMLSYFSN